MKRQKRTPGSIIEIDLGNGYLAYAQILEHGGYAFFDYKATERPISFDFLLNTGILFIIGVYNYVVNKGYWLKVAKLPIRNDLLVLPMEFIQYSSPHFSLYNPNTGEMTPATREECEGLECAAVWEKEHVESRLLDHFEGRPNIWVEDLKIK